MPKRVPETGVRVLAVEPGGLAAGAGLEPGDRLLRVNGQPLRDLVDFHVQAGEEQLAIEVDRGGRPCSVVLERCISHSRALSVLRVLDTWDIPCVNSFQVGEVCGDKLATNLALLKHGVPVPRARVAFTPESALEAIEELGYPAVLKPAVGSWGRLLARVNDREKYSGRTP